MWRDGNSIQDLHNVSFRRVWKLKGGNNSSNVFFHSVWPHYIFSLLPTFHLDLPALWIDGKTETGSQSSDTSAIYFLELLRVLAVLCQILRLSNRMNESLCSRLHIAPTFLTLALWPGSGAQRAPGRRHESQCGLGSMCGEEGMLAKLGAMKRWEPQRGLTLMKGSMLEPIAPIS